MDPSSQKHHFGFVGGEDGVTQFRFTTEIPVYQLGIREHRERLMRNSSATAREIITDALFEVMNWEVLTKLVFLFGNKIPNSVEILFEG